MLASSLELIDDDGDEELTPVTQLWSKIRASNGDRRLDLDDFGGIVQNSSALYDLLADISRSLGDELADPQTVKDALPIAGTSVVLGSLTNPFLGVAIGCLILFCKLKAKRSAADARRQDQVLWERILQGIDQMHVSQSAMFVAAREGEGATAEEIRKVSAKLDLLLDEADPRQVEQVGQLMPEVVSLMIDAVPEIRASLDRLEGAAERIEENSEAILDDTHEIKAGMKSLIAKLVPERVSPAPLDKGLLAIVYRRKTHPDAHVVELLEHGMPEFGYRVFIDRHLTIGVQWAQAIEQEIRGADAVIVVLSEKSAASEMVLFELQTALDQFQQTGKPKVLPIRVGVDEPVGGDVGALLNSLQYELWTGPQDDDKLLKSVKRALTAPPAIKTETRLERVGGAMPPDSPFYVTRPTDREFLQALLERDSIVLVKGARQIGKTSLMSRALRQAAESGARVVWTDLQAFGRAQIETDEKLYLAMACEFVDQLGLDGDPFADWRPMFGANTNFERFLQKSVLAKVSHPVIWAIDEVDRMFSLPYSGDFFGMVRSWHNRRAARLEETWGRFTVALAYATEAHLFISDLNQSPFNVGTRLDLADFGISQIADLNERYGRPLATDSELTQFHALVGGQPYLCRRGLDEMVRNGLSLPELLASAGQDEGPFGDHLRRLLVALSSDKTMLEEVRSLLRGHRLSSDEVFYRLRTGGLVAGSHRGDARLRCGIYGDYLKRHLA